MASLDIDFSQYSQSVVPAGKAVACQLSLLLPKEEQVGSRSWAWKGRDGGESLAVRFKVISPEWRGSEFTEWFPVSVGDDKDAWRVEKTKRIYKALASYRGGRLPASSIPGLTVACILSVWTTRNGEERNSVKKVLSPESWEAIATLNEAHGGFQPDNPN